ncbi:hypothetical protein PNK_2149 [Candidatus Protochlamydia naegleriophila]|uniref:Uncharacterized protein n=1 Tax=Candidatus Protochlamydia naegleriophila TaxID=389348 RepID=A0A0U5JD05_9BACT|nr:hypothetical protein [Candidatus Protochlamydia naegleriophila]CUI17752.1 hypothetical protein PNK_2149 [Candidatus Protochlamydia naegleriophila]
MCGGGACVGLDAFKPKVEVLRVVPKENGELEGRAYVYLKPQGFFERGLYAFQGVIQAEKITQIANECFHLFHRIIKARASAEIYNLCKNLHDGAHAFDEGLHAVTVFSGVLSMGAGTFIERKHTHGPGAKPIDYTRTAIRILHFMAHGLTTVAFLGKMKMISIGKLDERLIILGASLTLVGHTIHIISMVWRRFHSDHHHEHNFKSDFIIQGTGMLVQSVFVVTELNLVAKATELVLSQARSVAIIIQSLFILHRLSPDEAAVKFPLPRVAA